MRTLLLAIALSAFVATPVLACGPVALAGPLDALLPDAKLTADDLAKVNALRTQIRDLAAAGNQVMARKAEEQAMEILGYRKLPQRCGPGSFSWTKV
jgi:hypothetical protein